MRALYCGGGFIDSQILWLIPIIDGYCKKNKIETLIFERKLSQIILKKKISSNILKKYKIIYLKNELNFLKIFNIIFFILKNSFLIIYYSVKVERKILLKKKISWEKCQIFHSIWDTSFFYLKDGDLTPSFFQKLKASVRVFLNIHLAHSIKTIHTAFLGHSVYSARALTAIFRKFNIKIFMHGSCVIHYLPKSYDISSSFVNRKILYNIKRSNLKNIALKYWRMRLRGFSTYADARMAFQSKIVKKENCNFSNVVMLHIFRDSPFNIIDRERIFEDYVSWISNTLKILKDSNENWLIRPHPGFKRWGENSFETYLKIYKGVFGKNPCKNVKYMSDKLSNIDILKSAKRVITFNGTSHIEAACFGIKPIVISDCTLSHLSQSLVFKPKSYSEYSGLLLKNSHSSIFKLSKNKVEYAKFALFAKENIITLSTDLKSSPVYRGDGQNIKIREFNNVSRNLKNKELFLTKTGSLLGSKFKTTISEKYLNYFNFNQ
jgi:hypothetical protein